MNIYEKMAAITAEIKNVLKNTVVSTGNGSYRAVSERDILDAVKPLEEKYRVYSYPCDREVLESSVVSTVSTYKENYKDKTTEKTIEKNTFFVRMKTTYKFVNLEDPKDSVTTITFSEGVDSGDKGSGKAMTYADKYALMKAYKISTGDEPAPSGGYNGSGGYYGSYSDVQGSGRSGYRGKGRSQNQSQGQNHGQNQKTSQTQIGIQTAGQDGSGNMSDKGKPAALKCIRCGDEICDTKKKDGSTMTAKEVAARARQKYGYDMCAQCQKELNEIAKEQKNEDNRG